MAKILVVVPKEYLRDIALDAIKTLEVNADVILSDVMSMDEVIQKITKSKAKIVVARGYQATYLEENTPFTIVPICLTLNEIALLIKKACEIAQKKRPNITLFGYKNTFGDISHLDEVFDANIKLEMLNDDESIKLEEAKRDMVDVVIGGNKVVRLAKEKNMEAIFCDSSIDSIINALKTAKNMSFTIDNELKNYPQFNTLLDVSFNQIYQLNRMHQIELANKSAQNYIGYDIIGKNIEDVFDSIDIKVIDEMFLRKLEIYQGVLEYQKDILNYTLVPVILENVVKELILSVSIVSHTFNVNKEDYTNGYVASASFQSIQTKSEDYKNMIRLAKLLSVESDPLFISSGCGLDKENISEAIHNFSQRKNGPFIRINCFYKEEEMEDLIFNKAIFAANGGTLALIGFNHLPIRIQNRLFYSYVAKGDSFDLNEEKKSDVRFILISDDSLNNLHKNKLIIDELFYYLKPFELQIPPLNSRYDDLISLIRDTFDNFILKYKKNIKVDNEVIEYLAHLNWDGNDIEIIQNIKYIVIEASSKILSIEFVKRCMAKKNFEPIKNQNIYDPILNAYYKYNGNRTKMAKELDISTTTLWRKLKKYNLE